MRSHRRVSGLVLTSVALLAWAAEQRRKIELFRVRRLEAEPSALWRRRQSGRIEKRRRKKKGKKRFAGSPMGRQMERGQVFPRRGRRQGKEQL